MYHPSYIAKQPPRVVHQSSKQKDFVKVRIGDDFTVHVTLSPLLRNLFVNAARRAIGPCIALLAHASTRFCVLIHQYDMHGSPVGLEEGSPQVKTAVQDAITTLVHVDQLGLTDYVVPCIFVPTSDRTPWLGEPRPIAPPQFSVRYSHVTDPLSLFIDVSASSLMPSCLHENRPFHLCVILADAEVLLSHEFVVTRYEVCDDLVACVVARATAAQLPPDRAIDRMNKLAFARSELLKTQLPPQRSQNAPVIAPSETILLPGPGTAIQHPSIGAHAPSEPEQFLSSPPTLQPRVNAGLSTLCAIASSQTAHVPIGRKFAPSCAVMTAEAIKRGLIPPIEASTPPASSKRSHDEMDPTQADDVEDVSSDSDSGRDTPLNLPPEYLA